MPRGVKSSGQVAHEREIARQNPRYLRQLASDAISVLENYGKHHPWCERTFDKPCSCGIERELASLKDRLGRTREVPNEP